MLETSLDDIEVDRMVPKEFKNRDIHCFMLKINALCVPSESKPTYSNTYDHFKEQGKKALHFEVAKMVISYFKFLSCHAHKLKLNIKYFAKFAMLTATLG
jgi:hypothetical protein